MSPQIQYWLRRLLPLIGLVVFALMRFIEPEAMEATYYQVYGWRAYLCDILTCIAGSYAVFEISLRLTLYLERVLPWEHQPIQRLAAQLTGLLIMGSISIRLIMEVLTRIFLPKHTYTSTEQLTIRQSVVVGSLIILFGNAFYIGEYFFHRLKGAIIETEKLKRESVEARFETLRSQLSPHFLFNNLNTLINLVDENPPAVAFIEKLSLVYRYVLQSREQTLVLLEEELTLLRAYLFLLEQSHGVGIQVYIAIPDWALKRQIPPMTLQLLLENAVKHNQLDYQNPLIIRVTVNEQSQLVVQNSINPRLDIAEHTRIGLENIRSRYQLLAGVVPTIQHTAQTFTVKLPLLLDERADY